MRRLPYEEGFYMKLKNAAGELIDSVSATGKLTTKWGDLKLQE